MPIFRLGRNLASGHDNGDKGHGCWRTRVAGATGQGVRARWGSGNLFGAVGRGEGDERALWLDGDASGTRRARPEHADGVATMQRDQVLRGQSCPQWSPLSDSHSGAESWAKRCTS